jgi:hypothetical protein
MGKPFRIPLAIAAVALLAAPVLTGSSLTGTATAAESPTTTTVTADAAGDPVYARLYNQGTGKCLAVPESTTVQGTKLIQWTCSTSESEYWGLIAVPGGYQVKNLATGQCLAIGNSETQPAAKAIQWPCNGGESADDAEQVWARNSIDQLTNANSHLCLAIPGATTADRTVAIQWGCGGTDSKEQQWLW